MELSPQSLDILQFCVDAGADEFITDEPVNRFQTHKTTTPIQAPVTGSVTSLIEKKPELIIPKAGSIEAIKDAANVAAGISSIEELKTALNKFEGIALKRTASNMVFSEGVLGAKIMVIGDTPSADEDRSGRCFIGQAGLLLDKMLAAIGLNRDSNVYMTYMINWYPPGNRAPTDTEIAICKSFLAKHIELANPEVIICLGDIATKNLLDTSQSVSKLHGKWFEYRTSTDKVIQTMPIFRPEYLMAMPIHKGAAWQDLLKIKAYMQELAH